MTRDADFKRLVRQRMAADNTNYTASRAVLLQDRAADEAFYDRTVRTLFRNGRLVRIQAKRRARVVMLLELLQHFEAGRRYSEREVGDIIAPIHEDVASLRRELVDYRYLRRENGVYWVKADHLLERCANERQEVPLLANQFRMRCRPDSRRE